MKICFYPLVIFSPFIIVWIIEKVISFIDNWYIANSFEIKVGYQYQLSKNKKEIENYSNIGNQMVEIVKIDYDKLYPAILFTIKTINDNKIYKIKNL